MTTKKICITAMGIALFVVLALCLQVPVFENYYLCLGYVCMMVYCFYFGPFSGMLVGSLGVVLYCVLISGLRGMPGWAAGNLVIGFAVGLACKFAGHIQNRWLSLAVLIFAIVASTAVGILGVKSIVEVILYAQPMLLRVSKNFYAFAADAAVLVLSLPICAGMKGIVRRLCPEEILP